MARWIAIQLIGGAVWAGVYMIGRLTAYAMGYGIDLSFGDTLSVMIPTIVAAGAATFVWNRA